MRLKPLVAAAVLALGCRHRSERVYLPPSYYLDASAAYERAGQLQLARQQLALALDIANDPTVVLAARSALGRVAEASGDLHGAIRSLEAARELVKAPVERRAIDLHLARLYSDVGWHDDAIAAYDQALATVTEAYDRDEILREQIEEHRRAGTLAHYVATLEQAAALSPPDEHALHVLALHYGDHAGRTPEQAAAAERQLIPILEKLVALDPAVRDRLLTAYETTGNAAAARALIEAPAAPAAPEDACPEGLVPAPTPRDVAVIEQVVESLGRMNRLDEAAAETAKLLALSDPELRIAAPAMAARLYWALGRSEQAEAALALAARAAHTRDEQRLVAWTTAFGLQHAQRTGALGELYVSWQHADDICLRAEAERGMRQQLALVSEPIARKP